MSSKQKVKKKCAQVKVSDSKTFCKPH